VDQAQQENHGHHEQAVQAGCISRIPSRAVIGVAVEGITQPDGDASLPPVATTRRLRRRDPTDRLAISLLVKEAARGNQEAWDALVETFAPTVWAIIRGHRLCPADAADAFQTTWFQLLAHLDSIDQPERIGAWLASTARHDCLRLLRLGGGHAPGDSQDLSEVTDSDDSVSADRDAVAPPKSRVVNQLIEQLSVRSQILLRLLAAESPLSYRDISEALSMPIGSIGPTRARALERLRRAATGAGIEIDDVFFA
jgi:RNA polymerase sigma factor (sigma-70 family)